MNVKLTSKNFKVKYTITDKMLQMVWKISKEISILSNINGLNNYPKIRQSNRLNSIYSSLAIENIRLTYQQIVAVLNNKKVLGSQTDIIAAINAKDAYDMLNEIKYDGIDDLLRVHFAMMNQLIDTAGTFRDVAIFVGNKTSLGYEVVYKTPDANEVLELINQLFYWLKNNSSPIIIKSCVFHFYLACIHPFKDGNGRMARLWQTAILSSENELFKWIPIESAIYSKREQYYDVLKESNSSYDCTQFIEFMLDCIYESIVDTAKDIIVGNSCLPNHVLKMLSIMNKDHLSATQLMKKLKLKSKSGFIKNYLQPALHAGVISMSIPNQPTNKNQKYFKKNLK